MPMDPPEEGRQGHILPGPCPFPSAAGGRPAFDLAWNPCATGGTHTIRIVDGRVDRVVATRAEGAAPSGSRPAGRTEMRACNEDGGARIAARRPNTRPSCGPSACNEDGGTRIAAQVRSPVRTRTEGGQEQIVYRTSEMDEGRLYAAELNGEHYALRKSGPNVEVFKFRPDGAGGGGQGAARGGPRTGRT